jgi:hypothetical protein
LSEISTSLGRCVFRRINKIAKTTIRFVMSVCLSIAPSVRMETTRRIFKKFHVSMLLENPSRKFKFHSKPTRKTGTLRAFVGDNNLRERILFLNRTKLVAKSIHKHENMLILKQEIFPYSSKTFCVHSKS